MSFSEPINLSRGWPALSLLPIKRLQAAAEAVFDDEIASRLGMCYGPDPGYEPLRKALASWLGSFYASGQLNAQRFVITGGASQNLACILQVFTDPVYTQCIFVISPAYMMAFRIFEDNGFANKMVAIPEDSEGLDVERLKQHLEQWELQAGNKTSLKPLKPRRDYSKYYKYALYCVPSFSNPSSRVMSSHRRRELVKIARDHDILLISDDIYDCIQWRGTLSRSQPNHDAPSGSYDFAREAVLHRLVDIDRSFEGGASVFGNVVSNGSFSKICGPGLRCGWAESTPAFIYGLSQTGSSRSGGAPSQLTSTYMTNMLTSGSLQDHIRQDLVPSYRRRYNIMVEAIHDFLVPLGVAVQANFGDAGGGFFIWCYLPASILASQLAQLCKEKFNVMIAPGDMFEVPGEHTIRYPNNFRLCFSWVDETLLVQSIQSIAGALKVLLERQ